MKIIRRNRKALKIAVALAAVLLTATILTATTIQTQNQNTYPLIDAYMQGVPPNPNTVVRPKMDISTNTTLNGSVYYETINVIADNIVIDGNGFTVQGPGTGYGVGFNLTGRSNVTIKNVIVTGWYYGIYLYNSSYNNLSDNTANNNNFFGFFLGFSSYNNLSGNTANNNGYYGFFLGFSSYNNFLSGNTASNNGWIGFLLSGSLNNTLSGNTASYNGFYGFYLIESSTDNNLSGNIALNSKFVGYNWGTDCINNDFTGSVEANYLQVKVTDVLGYPITGADVKIETDGTVVYKTPHFNGTNSTTDSYGVTPWIAVPYRTFTTNDTMTVNTTIVTIWYSALWSTGNFSLNSRTVDMSTTHVETFYVPSLLPGLFNLLVLVDAQGGVSPLVYLAVGVAVFAVVVAAILFQYFRRVDA